MTEQKRNQITKQTTLFKSGEDIVEAKKVTPIFVNFFDGYMAWPYFHHKRLQNFFKRPQKYIVMNRQDCLEAEKISCRQKYK